MPTTDRAEETRRLIETRRDLHRNPELGYEEHRTGGIVAQRLGAAGYEVRTGVAITGVVGTLRGAGPGPTLLLRADMDALPIQEESSHEFVSTVPGKMHACGHDAHVAIALATAERLAKRREDWVGTVCYVFQPAEEGGGGALRMVNEGLLKGIDAAVGLHVWSGLPSGTVGIVEGPLMAGSVDFKLVIQGRGGHGAMPHETVDATVVSSQVVVALQQIVARNVSPMDTAVVTIGLLHSGTAFNVIASHALLEGTLRAFEPELLEYLRGRLRDVVAGITTAFGATFELTFGKQVYPPTSNDPVITQIVREAAESAPGVRAIRTDDGVRTMAAEDFSEFSTRVPGCYFFVGANNPAFDAVHPHHSPRFTVCEDALTNGVDILEETALRFLAPTVS